MIPSLQTNYYAEIAILRDLIDKESNDEIMQWCLQVKEKAIMPPQDLIGLGLISGARAEYKSALIMLLQAHEIVPDDPLVAECLAILYTIAGVLNSSIYYSKIAEVNNISDQHKELLPKIWPSFKNSYINIKELPFFKSGLALMEEGAYAKAIDLFETQLEFCPTDVIIKRMLAKAYLINNQPLKAGQILAQLLTKYNDPIDMAYSAIAAAQSGQFELSCGLLKAASAILPLAEEVVFATITCAYYDELSCSADLTMIVELALSKLKDQMEIAPSIIKHGLGTPLRIGILASSHQLNIQTAMTLADSDLKNIELIVFGHGNQHKDYNKPFQLPQIGWFDVANMDAVTLAYFIKQEAIDVTIDIGKQQTASHLTTIAYQPSAMSLSWFGIPADISEVGGYKRTFSAPLLDHQANHPFSMTSGLMGLFETTLVKPVEFASFDDMTISSHFNMGQLTINFMQAIADIMQALPKAKFIISYDCLPEIASQLLLCKYFALHGIDDRLIFINDNSAAVIAKSNLFLSPFIAQDSYATLMAIALGRPAIALAGDNRPSRFAASSLYCAHLPQWVATNCQDYVYIALNILKTEASLKYNIQMAQYASNAAECFNKKIFGNVIAATIMRNI